MSASRSSIRGTATADAWLASRRSSNASSGTSSATGTPVRVVAYAPSAPSFVAPPKMVVQAQDLPEVIAAGRVILPSIGQSAAPIAPAAEKSAVSGATLAVLDPLVKGGKVEVPLAKTFNTKGRADWLAGKFRRDLSVCCLFHKGRCHAGERCHQVHVDRETLDAVREAHASVICCCKTCGDTASASAEGAAFFKSVETVTTIRTIAFFDDVTLPAVPLGNLAYTVGTPELIRDAQVAQGIARFSTGRVCRLHLKGCCKYGRDCRHLHLCTKLAGAFGVDGAATPAVAAVAAAAPPSVVAPVAAKVVPQVSAPPAAEKPAAAPLSHVTASSAPAAAAVNDVTVSPKPLLAPAFLRANYPTLDQGSLRCSGSTSQGLMAPLKDDDMELTFRPFERLPLDLSPTYITARRFDDELSPVSTAASSTQKIARRGTAVGVATLESPSHFFFASAAAMNFTSPQ